MRQVAGKIVSCSIGFNCCNWDFVSWHFVFSINLLLFLSVLHFCNFENGNCSYHQDLDYVDCEWKLVTNSTSSSKRTYFDCYPRILISKKIRSDYAHNSLRFRGKELTLGFDTAVVTSFEPRFHLENDCRGIFHNFKIKYLENYKRYLEMINGVCFFFVGSFVSAQHSFWVDFSFNHLTIACQRF